MQRFYLAMAAATPLLTYLNNERGVVVRSHHSLPPLSNSSATRQPLRT
jgi:hypothetical protein